MRVAVCDPYAFFPLHSLVYGPLTDLSELSEVERFVRTVVLHDEISMDLEPDPYVPEADPEFTEEEEVAGGRSVIVATGPVLTGYDFFTQRFGPGEPETPDIPLSPTLIKVAREFSNADEGNVYYEAHIEYLQHIINIVRNGGSALLTGKFGSATIGVSTQFPAELFKYLDRDWQKFAKEVNAGELGFMVPPVLSIILTRCARREAIPIIIKDLRAEWADARAKVWALVDRLKTSQTLVEAHEIRQELASASRMLSPAQDKIHTRPVRVLWDLIAGSAVGGVTAMVSGGRPEVGAAIGALGTASKSFPQLMHDLGPALFGRGAFDLARRIRRHVGNIEYDALSRLLSDAEKRELGL